MRKGAVALIVVASASTIASWPTTTVSGASQSGLGVEQCLQAQLQVAIEQGGGNVPHFALGYTFLIVNTGPKSCELRGYPRETELSNATGQILKVSISHKRTSLFAQQEPQRMVLRPGGVASFGISYTYSRALSQSENSSCLAKFIDIRLPARESHLFSFEFDVKIDVCDAGRRIEVTPVEDRSEPKGNP
jgi:hypothetical protein